MACGEMGMDIDYFYGLTPREFSNIREGFNQARAAEFNDAFLMTKILSYFVYLGLPEKKKKKKFAAFDKAFFDPDGEDQDPQSKEDPQSEAAASKKKVIEFFKKVDQKNGEPLTN